MIYVPDVSFWQYRYKEDGSIEQEINFDLMSLKSPGVILRAGQGIVPDKVFLRSWRGAGLADMVRGTYWFYDPRVEPKRQAEAWAEITEGLPQEMEFFGDFERLLVGGKEIHGYDNPHQWYDFMEYSKQLMPHRKFGVYTGYYYWQERFFGEVPDNYWKQYPLWIASYGPKPSIPKPWDTYLFWQFTDNGPGPEYGVASGNIDLNSFNETLTDFNTKYQSIQENKMTTQFTMVARQDGTRARSSTETTDTSNVVTVPPHYPKGTVFGGNKMVSLDSNNVWMEVVEVNGVSVPTRYVARIFGGAAICDSFVDRGPVVIPPTDPVPTDPSDLDINISVSNGVATKVTVNGQVWAKA